MKVVVIVVVQFHSLILIFPINSYKANKINNAVWKILITPQTNKSITTAAGPV
jgi:hypothetical protein